MQDPVRAIADAVLYEGYILWPYRRSALKNAQRWTFGGVYPPAHARGRADGDDACTMQTECLLEGDAGREVSLGVRFLHVVWRQMLDADGSEVDELLAGDQRHLSWEEAVEREVTLAPMTVEALATGRTLPVSIDAGSETEPLEDGGSVVRRWEQLQGAVHIRASQVQGGVYRVTVVIENLTPWDGGSREAVMRRTLCSTHTVLHTDRGAFVSQTDPPPELRRVAEECENRGTWPVLVGDQGQRHTILSSPIILEDHPRIAPESPGDLFDGGEIDQLLILNILSLTDAEKAEVRASDPRVREILDRSQALSPEQLMRLHGRTVRESQVRSTQGERLRFP
jgi:hypothetical protein